MADSSEMISPASSATHRRYRLIAFAAIVALAAILTIHRLGAADVCGFNEAVEGVFTQQMVEHGELLFPLLNGRTPMYKPPLFHWTATTIDRTAGITRVTPFNLRLPAALYAIAGVALTLWFTADLLGFNGAILAGLILCGSYQYIEQGRLGRVDMTLCFFETLALFTFARWIKMPRRDSLRYLFAIALGFAVLAKGPVGAILPASACGVFLILERRLSNLRRIAALGPLLLAIAIGSSWYALCYFAGRDAFLHRQLGSENLGRFFGSLGAMAPWYYALPLLLNSAPLSLLAPCAVFAALRTYWAPPGSLFGLSLRNRERASLRAAAKIRPRAATPLAAEGDSRTDDRALIAVRLFAIFWTVTVFFFSIAAYKRRSYLLPLWPVSAVMLAWFILRISSHAGAPRENRGLIGAGRRFLFPAMIAVTAGSIFINFLFLPDRPIHDCGDDSFRTTAAEINRIVGADEPLYSYGLGEEPATLIFYLDRDLPPLAGKLGDAPPGYVVAPAQLWRTAKDDALDLTPVFTSTSGREPLVLLRHGKALAGLFGAVR
jgi:4-amino-4-deoxy-L-arabinose transferase-like glycosyltransferase